MLQNELNENVALQTDTLRRLGQRFNVPTYELHKALVSPHSLDREERIFAVCQLSCITRIALLQNGLTYGAAKALYQKVIEIFKALSQDEFRQWFMGRDEGHFGVHKDFVALEQKFGSARSQEVGRILEDFRIIVREKLGDPKFDIIADALEKRAPTFLGTLFYQRKHLPSTAE